MWGGYVKEHLLPRIFGFELMMAPYAMAHLKLGMQLAAHDMPDEERASWAYDFDNNERLRVYLTNALEQSNPSVQMFGPMRVIIEEANAAAEIKRDLPIMVVLGNPPYSGHSSNPSRRNGKLTWIGELIEDYKRVDGKPLGERNSKWLQNDYVKFVRFGQWRIQQSGSGVLAFITSNSYLDSPTFRGMRQQLMDTFTDIYLLDLHGNSLKKETAPDGGVDANVFDIQEGVAIAIFIKEPGESGRARVHHADLYGEREGKYETLSETGIVSTNWECLQPRSPNYLFRPWDNELMNEYECWRKITDVMPVNSAGIVTGRDRVAIQWERDEMLNKASEVLTDVEADEALVTPVLYRPFDTRYTYFSRSLITRRRETVMQHMLAGSNIGLITCRQQARQNDSWQLYGISDSIIESCAISNTTREINSLFPLYTHPPEEGLESSSEREPNLSPEFTADLERRLGFRFTPDGAGDLTETFGPEDALHYIYAVFHSTAYRERYDQFLRADFPRVPLTDDLDLFRTLVELGERLTDAHLLRSTFPNAARVAFPATGDNVVERAHPKYYAPGERPTGEKSPIERGRVYISKNNRRSGKLGQYFEGVTPSVWASRVGGYQPMDKWLKDRKGRALSFGDIASYQRIAAALQETLRLTEELDVVVADGGMFG